MGVWFDKMNNCFYRFTHERSCDKKYSCTFLQSWWAVHASYTFISEFPLSLHCLRLNTTNIFKIVLCSAQTLVLKCMLCKICWVARSAWLEFPHFNRHCPRRIRHTAKWPTETQISFTLHERSTTYLQTVLTVTSLIRVSLNAYLSTTAALYRPYLTFLSLLVTLSTNRFNIQQFYPLPKLYFCVLYLSRNKQRQHKRIGFYNRHEKCLLRGTDWVFKGLMST
jgi:hypothetical protein